MLAVSSVWQCIQIDSTDDILNMLYIKVYIIKSGNNMFMGDEYHQNRFSLH